MNSECAKCVMADVCTYYPYPPPNKSSCRFAIYAEAVDDSSLTKREQFAMAAMQSLCTKDGGPYCDSDHVAKLAVIYADKLIEELNK